MMGITNLLPHLSSHSKPVHLLAVSGSPILLLLLLELSIDLRRVGLDELRVRTRLTPSLKTSNIREMKDRSATKTHSP